MNRKLTKIAFSILTALVASLAFALGPIQCPIDHTLMSWTGNTQEEGGKKLAEYRCNNNHTSWVVIN